MSAAFTIVFHATQWFPVNIVGIIYLVREGLSLGQLSRLAGSQEDEPAAGEVVGEGGESEPPGTVAFGLADESGTYGWKYRLPGDREMVRQFATTVALSIAFFYVRGEEIKDVR